MTDATQRALDIFTELGWWGAEPGDLGHLPMGNAEQQRVALHGLSTGPWDDLSSDNVHESGGYDSSPVDLATLTVFAVRLGVSAQRTARLIAHYAPHHHVALLECITARGETFASGVVEGLRTYDNRLHHQDVNDGAHLAVRLVRDLHLPLPDSPVYYHDWALLARWLLGTPAHAWDMTEGTFRHDDQYTNAPRDRFAEHALRGAAKGVPAVTLLGTVVQEGYAAGWLTREEVIDTALTGLSNALRPADRARWAGLLVDVCAISDEEFLTHRSVLAHAVSTSENRMVEILGLPLLRLVDDTDFTDVALPCLYARTQKAQVAVLAAIRDRSPGPPDVLATLGERLNELAAAPHTKVAKAAAEVLTLWGTQPTQPRSEPGVDGKNLWQETPPVWDVPRFERGPATQESLSQALRDAFRAAPSRSVSTVDVGSERVLAVAVEYAHKDLAGCLTVLRNAERWLGEFSIIAEPDIREYNSNRTLDRRTAVEQRAALTTLRLGAIPCLLSEPSFEDLTVTWSDLVRRLEVYAQAGARVQAPDLFLALCRLRVETITDLPARDALVDVERPDGTLAELSAQQVVANYAESPWNASGLDTPHGRDDATSPHVELPESLTSWTTSTPTSFHDNSPLVAAVWPQERYAAFPNAGDATLLALRREPWSAQGHLVHVCRQVARRRVPLPPGGAINLLGVQRFTDSDPGGEVGQSVDEAWARGLLRPGVADFRLLDWQDKPPPLAAFVAVLVDVAERGMLSVAWPILDDAISHSVSSPRLRPGTVDAAAAMKRFSGHVAAAVADSTAPTSALAVPGLRALAGRKGTSRAVTLARETRHILDGPARPRQTPTTMCHATTTKGREQHVVSS